MSAQAANLTVSMGNNDDFSLAERPWTAQSLSYDMKYIQQQQKKNMKIFTTEKDGRPYSRNLVLDAPTWGTNQSKIRKSNMDVGEEMPIVGATAATGGGGIGGSSGGDEPDSVGEDEFGEDDEDDEDLDMEEDGYVEGDEDYDDGKVLIYYFYVCVFLFL